ncbi:hypothetical protein FRB93_007029, partial [Tulasnella sp. JGI-2019a]
YIEAVTPPHLQGTLIKFKDVEALRLNTACQVQKEIPLPAGEDGKPEDSKATEECEGLLEQKAVGHPVFLRPPSRHQLGGT